MTILKRMPLLPSLGRARSAATRISTLLKNDVAHSLTVSAPNRDRLTMRSKPLKTLDLILSLSKDEAQIQAFSAAC
ncbi:MAG: hypothetical protein WBS14_16770 [Rhodomicrobium sp.]